MSSKLPQDVTLCTHCGYRNAILGEEYCESCLPTVLKEGEAVANKALEASDLMAKKLRELLEEPEKYGIDEAKRKEIENTLRFMADENENTRQKLRSAKRLNES